MVRVNDTPSLEGSLLKALATTSLALVATGCVVSTLPGGGEPAGPDEVKLSNRREAIGTIEDQDAPEISRSLGKSGGFLVLWPRVAPKTGDPAAQALAVRLQHRLDSLLGDIDAGAPSDVRPEPEKVCPKTGCAAVAVGVVVTMKGESCAAAVTVAKPGQSPTRIIPWIGKIELKRPITPFREPPEGDIKVSDFASCKKVIELLDQNAPPGDEAPLKNAIQAAHKG